MERITAIVALAAVVLAINACAPQTYDPLDQPFANFTVTDTDSLDDPEALPFELPAGPTTSVCLEGDALETIRPLLDENGTGVFKVDGRTVRVTVQPIPDSVAELLDRGAAIGCTIG